MATKSTKSTKKATKPAAKKATKPAAKKATKPAAKKATKPAAKKATKPAAKKATKPAAKKATKPAAKKAQKNFDSSAPKLFSQRRFSRLEKFRNPTAKRNGETRFLHITKTAGTSVRSADGVNPWWHRRYRSITSHELPDEDFLFTCIRNPYDRAISWYHYVHGQLGNSLKTLKEIGQVKGNNQYLVTMSMLARGATLNEYWAKFMKEENFVIHHKGFIYAASQVEYLRDKGCSPSPISPRFDFLMKFEQIQSDWDILREHRGLGELGWLKKSRKRERKKHWSEVLSSEAIDNITKFYAEDFDVLPYTKYAD